MSPEAVPASGTEVEADAEEEERVESPVTPRYIASDPIHLSVGTFVASVQRSGFKRLRVIGGCSRTPGIDYANVQSFGQSRPAATEYNQACRQCFNEQGSVVSSSSTSDEEASDA